MAERHDVVTDPFTKRLIKIKAAHLSRRGDFSRSDREDIEQGMLLYLLEKERLFDPSRGNLQAFVTKALNSWVAMELRFRSRDRRRLHIDAISLEGTMVESGGDADTLASLVGDDDLRRRTGAHPLSPVDAIDLADEVRAAFARLAPAEQELLSLVARHGIAGAARVWSRRRRRKVWRREIAAAVALMRERFGDPGLGAT